MQVESEKLAKHCLRIGNKFQRPPLSLDNRNKIILESKFYFLKNINNSSPKT